MKSDFVSQIIIFFTENKVVGRGFPVSDCREDALNLVVGGQDVDVQWVALCCCGFDEPLHTFL